MKKTEKALFVSNLAEIIKSSSSFVLVNYSGMNVKTQQKFKSHLKKAGASMLVVKNTLLRLAGKLAKIPSEVLSEQALSGQTAIISTENDSISPLQVIKKFSDEHNTPELKVGVVEGHFQDKDSLIKLSKIPGKEALFAQLFHVLLSPAQQLIYSLNNKPQELLFVLNSARKKSSIGGDNNGR